MELTDIFVVETTIPSAHGSQKYTSYIKANSTEEAIKKAISLIDKEKVKNDIFFSDITTNDYFDSIKESFRAFVQKKDSTIDINLLKDAFNPYDEKKSVDFGFQNKVKNLMNSFIHENFDDFLKFNTSCEKLILYKVKYYCTGYD